jgi:hypothetical protein
LVLTAQQNRWLCGVTSSAVRLAAGANRLQISFDPITNLWRKLPTMRRPANERGSMRIFVVLACVVGLAISASVADAARPPAAITHAASVARAQQPKTLTPTTANAANKVPASYNASLMVCPTNSTGRFYVLSPYIEPRDSSQNGWVAFFDVIYRRTSSGGWSQRYATQPLYHYKPSDIFEQALQVNSMAWQDANGNVSPTSGDFAYRGLRGYWYVVLTYYLWAPQPSYPNSDSDILAAHQDPLGTDARGALCQAGTDRYPDPDL